jgi:hypothetical protein
MQSNDSQEQTALFLAQVQAIKSRMTQSQFKEFMNRLDDDARSVAQMFLDEVEAFPRRDYSSFKSYGTPRSQST